MLLQAESLSELQAARDSEEESAAVLRLASALDSMRLSRETLCEGLGADVHGELASAASHQSGHNAVAWLRQLMSSGDLLAGGPLDWALIVRRCAREALSPLPPHTHTHVLTQLSHGGAAVA